MEKLHKLILLLASNLIAANLWAASRLGLHGHIMYFLFGVSNILIIGG